MAYSEQQEETIKNLYEKNKEIRDKWTFKIKELSETFKKLRNLPEAQATLYHDIQELNEVSTQTRMELSKLSRISTNKKKSVWIEIKTTCDFELKTKSDFDIWLEDEIVYYTEIENISKNQLQFYEESLKILNSMIYGIKYRIALEQEILS